MTARFGVSVCRRRMALLYQFCYVVPTIGAIARRDPDENAARDSVPGGVKAFGFLLRTFYLWLTRRTSQSPKLCSDCTNAMRITTTAAITSGIKR